MSLKKLMLSIFMLVSSSRVLASIDDSQKLDPRLKGSTWTEVYEKLVNSQMPNSYYEYLNRLGVTNINDLYSIDDNTKQQLLQMYDEDKLIMATSDATRSQW